MIKNGVDGKDGLEPTVTAKRNSDNNGVTLTITPRSRDEKGNIVDGTPQTVEIKDGAKGEKGLKGDTGAQGAPGEKGADGKSPEVSTTETKDGHTITIKNPDGSTTSFEVKNGQKGDKGDQGERGPQGTAGADGKSPEISTNENSDGSHTITIKNPNGTTTSFVVKNGQKGDAGAPGKDGKSPVVFAQRGFSDNSKKVSGTWLRIKNPETLETTNNIFIPDGAKGETGAQGPQGERGVAGDNGKSFVPVLTKDNNGTTTIKFYPVNPETGKADTSKEAVATGEIKDGAKGDKGEQGERGLQGERGPQGTAGTDGKSPEISTTENADGSHTITIKNPNGTTTSFVVKNGQKGEAGTPGKDGKTPVVFAQRGFSDNTKKVSGTWLRIKNPETLETTNNIFIPDGAKGDKGDTGAQGPKGDQGERGAQGVAGTNGKLVNLSLLLS